MKIARGRRAALDLRVRPTCPEDAAAVERVLKASYPQLMARAYDSDLLARALPLMTRPHPRLLASGLYYLCELEGRVVGCGGWPFEKPGGTEIEPGIAHIRHFATDSAWIGRGVGRALYRRCEEAARAAGVRTFHCYASLNGEGFYRALGFTRIAPIVVAMAADVALPSILMRRPLGGASHEELSPSVRSN